MRPLNVFRALTTPGSRIGFYTKDSKKSIPEAPGCYAWLLPLWLYHSDLDELVRIVGAMLDYEHQPTKRVSVPFTWQSIDLELSRARKKDTPTGTKYATWNKLLEHAGTRMALQETLLEASLLMPPLYVGRTNNLRQRYLQHVQDSEPTKNDFHSRFAEHAADLSLKISVNDLIFFCIRTPKELRAYFGRSDNSQSNTLVEQILMLLCRPPFSIR